MCQNTKIRRFIIAALTGLMLIGVAFTESAVAAPKIALKFAGTYDAGSKYAKGDGVFWNGTLYQALKPIQRGSVPGTDATLWRVVLEGYAGSGGGGNDCRKIGPGANLVACDYSSNNIAINPDPSSATAVDLTGANLTRAVLVGNLGLMDFTGAQLVAASFGLVEQGGAGNPLELASGSRFDYANLGGLRTQGGNAPFKAEDASFVGANLKDAYLDSADLAGASFFGAMIEGVTFNGADLSRAGLSNLSFKNVGLSYAVNLRDATLSGSDLRELNSSLFENIALNRATVLGANFQKLYMGNVDLTGADLSFSNFSDVVVTGPITVGADPDTGLETTFFAAICPDHSFVDGQIVTTCMDHGLTYMPPPPP